jgi:hypothetical protein
MNTTAKKPKPVNPVVTLTDGEAYDLPQFLKRVGFSEFRSNAVDEDEAYRMRDAAGKVARARDL